MEKIILRKLTVDDVDDLLAIISNPDVVRFIPGMIQDRDTLVSWINNLSSAEHEYMIIKQPDVPSSNERRGENKREKIIGECSLDARGEIGLMLRPEFWRQGYGTATVQKLMKIALDLGLTEVTAHTVAENEACVGLLRSLGFTVSGMGWFVPEEALVATDDDMKLSQGMIIFNKNIGENREERP